MATDATKISGMPMSKPLISILIPVYNRGTLLKHTVDSALNQTYDNIEVVIVDNCSTDDTWEVCNYYRAKDSRVRIFRNDSNIGPVRNWQRCVSEAQGEFAKLLFSDDLMSPDCIDESISLFSSDDIGFVFSTVICGSEQWRGDELYIFKKTTGVYSSKYFIAGDLFDSSTPVSPAAAVFRTKDLARNILDNIPSPTITDFCNHGAGPDLLTFLLTASQYRSVGFIRKPLMYFRAHNDSITISSNKNNLLNAYRQARIWFSENFLTTEACMFVYAYEWKRYCRREHSWMKPRKVLSKFSNVGKLCIKEALLVRILSSKLYRKRVEMYLANVCSLIASVKPN